MPLHTPSTRSRRGLAAILLVASAVATVLLAITSAAAETRGPAGLSPATGSVTVIPGGTATEAKVVTVPAKPPSVDIELAFDTTGSMAPSLSQAKTDASAIVTQVQAQVADSRFAVVQFKDSMDAVPYQVVQDMTPTASLVAAAINTLSASGGDDEPEAYNLVFHNSYSPTPQTPPGGGSLTWRPATRKFVIVIGDASPHGNLATQGLAGCADVTAEPFPGLVTSTELAGMKANQRTLIMIRQASSASTTLACYQSLAAGAFSDGQGVDSNAGTSAGMLASQIVSLVNAAFSTVSVQLQVSTACSPPPAANSWIAFSPATLTSVPAPSTQNFTVTVTVPAATPPGTYTCDIVALADGVDIGHQQLTIIVRPPVVSLGLDHFKCYVPKSSPAIVAVSGTGVTLLDQLDKGKTESVTVRKLIRFCNPVKKTYLKKTTSILNPKLHLAFYSISTKTKKPVTVVIDNQFGPGQKLRLGSPQWLAVPTSFSSNKLPDTTRLSHFKCYPVQNILVDLNDPAFKHNEKSVSIGAPYAFCDPALKTHKDKKYPIVNDKRNLVCYQFALSPINRKITIYNQFNKKTSNVTGADLLCVPSVLISVK